jgi:multiple sugar transport system substrate-binding protein
VNSSKPTVRLRGIAWNHTRGFTPKVATAQRYTELHPEVEITWEKRSLQAFADAPIEKLADEFDLLIIDHPFAGFAARHPALLDMNTVAPAPLLVELQQNSVGASFDSYQFAGNRCALPIDAATPISGWREDLLQQHKLQPPQTWPELLELARAGLVAVAGIPVDCLMNFFMCCHAQGEAPCLRTDRVVGDEKGGAALEMLRELMELLPDETWTRNPIRIWDRLAHADTDGPAYCPFAYGYANYARAGYAPHALKFGGMVSFQDRLLRPTLGGTGLAVAAKCAHPAVALEYAALVAGGHWQRTLYFDSGGQPAHRTAWTDRAVNQRSNDFFAATLTTMENSWMRPRYAGYLYFQDHAGDIVRNFLIGKTDRPHTLTALNRLYLQSFKLHP